MKTKKGKLRGIVAIVVTLMMLVSLLGVHASTVLAASIDVIIDSNNLVVYTNDTVVLTIQLHNNGTEDLTNATTTVDNGIGTLEWLSTGSGVDDMGHTVLWTSNGNNDSILDIDEEWVWMVIGVNVLVDTSFVATGSAWGVSSGEQDIYVSEVTVEVIDPDTAVTIASSAPMVPTGTTVDLTVTETNTGDSILENAHVIVNNGSTNIATLDENHSSWSSNLNTDAYLDVNETWSWTITGVVINYDVTFEAIGHGMDPAGNDITWPAFENERATVLVETARPDTDVNISASESIVYAGETVDILVTETNTGIEDLGIPYVDVNGMYTLDRDSTYFTGGDQASGDPGYGILEMGETWEWEITDVQVNVDTIFTANGHGYSADLDIDVCWDNGYENERDTFEVNAINSDTDTGIWVAVEDEEVDPCGWYWYPSEAQVLVLDCDDPDTVCLWIEEINIGDDPLDNVYVEVYAVDLDGNEVLLYTLDQNSPFFWVYDEIEDVCPQWDYYGDTNNDGILSPDEGWMWLICDVPVEDDTVFVSIGHGMDSLGNDVTWYSEEELLAAAEAEPPIYLRHQPSERDEAFVNVYCPDTQVDICIDPCTSPATVRVGAGDTVDLRISEENTGTEPLGYVYVVVTGPFSSPLSSPIILDIDSEYYRGGDTNGNGILDPDEMWRWLIEDVVVNDNSTFEAYGYGTTWNPYNFYRDGDPDGEEISANYGYEGEYDDVDIITINPGTEVCISGTPDCCRPGDSVDLEITEENSGDQPLTDVSVTVSVDDVILYTLVKGDAYWDRGDTNGDNVLDPGEIWTWKIDGIVVDEDTTYIVIGDATDPLGNSVTWPEYQNERARLDIDVINPDTEVTVCVDDEEENPIEYIYSGDPVNIVVIEENTGDDPLTDPYVWVGGVDTATGVIIDINLADTTANGFTLTGEDSGQVDFVEASDANGNGRLDPGEMWTWYITDVVIENDDDVTIIAKGHGKDSLGEDVAYPNYPKERDRYDIDVIHPNTDVDICTYPCLSPACVYEGLPFILRVSESNTGDVPLTDIYVVVSSNLTVTGFPLTLDKDSGSATEITFTGDINHNGILDVGEMWTWLITGVVIDEETIFSVLGYGTDPLDNEVSLYANRIEYADEYDEVTVRTIDPNTVVNIITSAPAVPVGDTIDITITELNNGDDPLDSPYVEVYANDNLVYTLTKTSDYYASGDTNLDGILDPAERWTWFIPEVVVGQDTTYVAIGHGTDFLGNDVTWYSEEELNADPTLRSYRSERYQAVVDTIGPNTEVKISTSSGVYKENVVGVGRRGVVDLTITEKNTGDEPLTAPRVWVGAIDLATGLTVDLNVDPLYTGLSLGKNSPSYVSGDTDNDGVLDLGETWTWVVEDLLLEDDVRIIVKGHGMDSLGNDVTYPDYPRERAAADIVVIDPNTEVCVSTDLSVPAGGMADLTVTEQNIGDDPLTDVSVTVTPGNYILTKDSEYYVEGDTNGNGILDPDDPETVADDSEIWVWVIPVVVDDSTTFVAIGDGIDSLGNHVTYPDYPDERDQLTVGTVSTTICMNVCPCPIEEHDVYPGDELTVTINETNDGDVAIYDAYVWLGGINPVTGMVLDLNNDNEAEETNGWAMGINDSHYVGGDTNANGILDPGETWVWVLTDVVVQEDVLLVAKGHGTVSGSAGDITYPEYPTERAATYVDVIETVS